MSARSLLDSLRFGGSSGTGGNDYSRVRYDAEDSLVQSHIDEGDEFGSFTGAAPADTSRGTSGSEAAGRGSCGLLTAAFLGSSSPAPPAEPADPFDELARPATDWWGRPGTSAFDRYGTFPDQLIDDEPSAASPPRDFRGAAARRRAAAGDVVDSKNKAVTSRSEGALLDEGGQPSSSGRVGEAEYDSNYDVVDIYVVPLLLDQMVVIPVPKNAPAKTVPGWMKGVMDKGTAVQKKVAENWDSLKHSEPDSFKSKIYRAGQSQLESLTPEQRLLGGIPDYAKRLRIFHSPHACPEDVMAYIASTIQSLGHIQRYKQVGAAALLPFTFVIDSVVIPGPAILTGLTGYHLYHYSKAAAGSQRLKKFVDREAGTPGCDLSVDDIDFIIDERLEKYYDTADRDEDGILMESAIEELCEELSNPELEEVLQQLRRRQLRLLGRLPTL